MNLAALSAIPVAAAAIIAAPAVGDSPNVQANCVSKQSIWPNGMAIEGSAGTVCDSVADTVSVYVWVRHQSAVFGTVDTCGGMGFNQASMTTTVTAAPASCLSTGTGDTYWIYSEHHAYINGQQLDWHMGGWDSPTG